jgi:hypothetical protein
MRELRAAFVRLQPGIPGFSVLPPVEGQLRERLGVYLVGQNSPEVILFVEEEQADLKAHSGEEQRHAGTALIHDILSVNLTTGFNWDDACCDTADELAYLLTKHMRRRLKAVTELEPE